MKSFSKLTEEMGNKLHLQLMSQFRKLYKTSPVSSTRLDARQSKFKGKTGRTITFDFDEFDTPESALSFAKKALSSIGVSESNNILADSRKKVGGWKAGKFIPIIHVID